MASPAMNKRTPEIKMSIGSRESSWVSGSSEPRFSIMFMRWYREERGKVLIQLALFKSRGDKPAPYRMMGHDWF
jgi:hypothetical protein